MASACQSQDDYVGLNKGGVAFLPSSHMIRDVASICRQTWSQCLLEFSESFIGPGSV